MKKRGKESDERRIPKPLWGQHKKYGFKDKNSVIGAVLDHSQKEFEKEKLMKSADLYAEIYDKDKELRKLTESAISEWPE